MHACTRGELLYTPHAHTSYMIVYYTYIWKQIIYIAILTCAKQFANWYLAHMQKLYSHIQRIYIQTWCVFNACFDAVHINKRERKGNILHVVIPWWKLKPFMIYAYSLISNPGVNPIRAWQINNYMHIAIDLIKIYTRHKWNDLFIYIFFIYSCVNAPTHIPHAILFI